MPTRNALWRAKVNMPYPKESIVLSVSSYNNRIFIPSRYQYDWYISVN